MTADTKRDEIGRHITSPVGEKHDVVNMEVVSPEADPAAPVVTGQDMAL
jgi:hypothetical protein